jgi:hypothetical protein
MIEAAPHQKQRKEPDRKSEQLEEGDGLDRRRQDSIIPAEDRGRCNSRDKCDV